MLHIESRKSPEPLSELENYAWPGRDPRRDHCVATRPVGAGHREMSCGPFSWVALSGEQQGIHALPLSFFSPWASLRDNSVAVLDHLSTV